MHCQTSEGAQREALAPKHTGGGRETYPRGHTPQRTHPKDHTQEHTAPKSGEDTGMLRCNGILITLCFKDPKLSFFFPEL